MAGHDKLTPQGVQFFKAIEELKRLQVRIGYQRGKNSKRDEKGREVDYCDIALFNELGTSNGIPSRPFLRDSVDTHASQIDAAGKACIAELSKGATAESILKKLGVMQKGLVQQTIVDGSFAPNAPSTVRRKKSDKPLIETGGMRKFVNVTICKKGEFD